MLVFVTGSSGYIGSALVPKLLQRGHTVVHYRHSEGMDVRDLKQLRERMDGCDAVIHLAAVVGDKDFDANPEVGYRVNNPRKVASACRMVGIKRLVYASTYSVRGVDTNGKEEGDCSPVTEYNESKWSAEYLLKTMVTIPERTVIVRPGSVCGPSPKMRWDTTINAMTKSAVETGTITINGGDQTRGFVHVEDLADAFCNLLEAPVDKVCGQVFNVGRENHTVGLVAHVVKLAVEARFGTAVDVLVLPIRDFRSYRINGSKYVQAFGPLRHSVTDAVTGLCALLEEKG